MTPSTCRDDEKKSHQIHEIQVQYEYNIATTQFVLLFDQRFRSVVLNRGRVGSGPTVKSRPKATSANIKTQGYVKFCLSTSVDSMTFKVAFFLLSCL